jgi:hypothetical protein
VTLLVGTLALGLAAPALADPPANDLRTAPQAITLPAQVRATTSEATVDADEPFSDCGAIKNSVWYSFTASDSQALVVALDASGDMDAVVDVYQRVRSQLTPISCRRTNAKGAATLDVDTTAKADYLIRVAPLANSVAAGFLLRVVVPQSPATPPGTALPAAGLTGSVDPFSNPDNAYAARLTKGVTYRVNLVTTGPHCVRADLFAPGFYGRSAKLTIDCDQETVFTPPRSGVYSLRVKSPRASRTPRTYRVAIGRAGPDDSAPGIPLADDHRLRGSLHGSGLDALDLYRFTVDRRSDVRFRLTTTRDFNLVLLNASGGRLACGCGEPGTKEYVHRLRKGRYFLAVRALDGAGGGYVLSRLARVITRSRMLVQDRRDASFPPGSTVSLHLAVTPDVNGRATLVIERFDPLAGWLFYARRHPRNTDAVAFRPPFPGKWRVTGSYDGTRTSSPSDGGTATFQVLEPLAPTPPR